MGSFGRMRQYTSQVRIARRRSICERVCQNREERGKLHSRVFPDEPRASLASYRILCPLDREMAAISAEPVVAFTVFTLTGMKCPGLAGNGGDAGRLWPTDALCNLHRQGHFCQTRHMSIALGRSRLPEVLQWPSTR